MSIAQALTDSLSKRLIYAGREDEADETLGATLEARLRWERPGEGLPVRLRVRLLDCWGEVLLLGGLCLVLVLRDVGGLGALGVTSPLAIL